MWTAALRGDPKTIKAISDQIHYEKARKDIVLRMHRKAGLSPEQISFYTGVDLDQVLSIIKAG